MTHISSYQAKSKRQSTLQRHAFRFEHVAVRKIAAQAKSQKSRPSSKSQDLTQIPLQAKSGGKSIPDGVRAKMENAFNTSFSDVKIHEGSEAASVGALAYTERNHIHFAPGQFKPDTLPGQALLGHELTHVVQQRQGRVQPTNQINGLPVNDDPALEKEADRRGLKAALS